MVLQHIFSESTIIMNLESESKDELFYEMVQKIVDACPAVDRKEALESLFSRETYTVEKFFDPYYNISIMDSMED